MGVQVDVTSKTEGKIDEKVKDHLLINYDARLRTNVANAIVEDVTTTVQVRPGG